MKLNGRKYKGIALVEEMLETAEVIANFNLRSFTPFTKAIQEKGRLFLTGEGSSRIFPAKHAIRWAQANDLNLILGTQGGRQAAECALKNWAVFGASNSGRTKELMALYKTLKRQKHQAFFGLTAGENSPLEKTAVQTHVLSCGGEKAVAATKSVAEQALFYHALVRKLGRKPIKEAELKKLGKQIQTVLESSIPSSFIKKIAKADRIYFAGRNDGVAEELTLKTNEITRKPSAFFEGTYAVHGVEEVMTEKDVVIVVDPFPGEIDKFRECLEKGVGCPVLAIASKQLSIPTLVTPQNKEFSAYLQLAAGWNILVEVGLSLGVDLDHPVRARKVGNEA